MKKLLAGKRKSIVSFFIVAMLLVLPLLGLTAIHSASAGGGVIDNINKNLVNTDLEELGGQGDQLPQTIGRIIGVLLGLLGVVFVIIVIYAGFMWMMAQGDEAKIGKARKTILQGVIAIIIIFAAYAITSFVINQVGGAASGQSN